MMPLAAARDGRSDPMQLLLDTASMPDADGPFNTSMMRFLKFFSPAIEQYRGPGATLLEPGENKVQIRASHCASMQGWGVSLFAKSVVLVSQQRFQQHQPSRS